MSAYLIALCGLLYVGTAVDLAIKGQWLWAGVYLGYASSNVFLVMLASKG